MKERSYNVRDEEESADREMKEKCLDVNGEHDADKKPGDSVDGEKGDRRFGNVNECAKQFGANRILLIIVLLCVTVLVFFIIIIALAVRIGRLEQRTDEDLCRTAECLGASSKIVSNWNTTFDPCQDFWNFSCGEWLKKHPLPNNRGSIGVKDLLTDKVHSNLRHLLDLVPHDAPVRDPEWKAQKFYQSCMNVDAVEQTEDTFKNILNEVGGWKLLNNWSSQRWDRNKVIKQLHSKFGVTPFFKFVIEPDDTNPTANIIKILPAGLGLPNPRYYFLTPDNKYETIYRTYMDNAARQLGGTPTESSRLAVNTFNFEKRLAEVSPTLESYRDPFSHYKRITIQQLGSLAPTIPWAELLQMSYPRAKINRMTEVMIFSESYFKQLSTIVSSTDDLALHNYLMWQFTFTYAPHLSRNLREIANHFYQSLQGVPNPSLQSDERWEYCIKVTSQYLGHVLGAMYVKHYFVPDSAKEAQDVQKEIQGSFNDNLQSIPWAEDSETRSSIQDKMESLLLFWGYPAFVASPEALSDYYTELEVHIDFLENIKRGKEFLLKIQERKLTSQVTTDGSWTIFPQDVQAIYHYQGNQLVVPAGLLQDPIYEPGAPLSVRFGSLGTHIASQMFKALDDKGISYQKLGALDPWLSGKSALRYQQKTECLMNRILDDEDSGTANSNLTVGELVADIAAIKFAYQAYRNMEREYELPGIGRKHDEIFFVAYAQSMCENIRPEKISIWSDASTTTAPHKRVVNALRQLPEFSEAFSCPAGSNMNPNRSCRMW